VRFAPGIETALPLMGLSLVVAALITLVLTPFVADLARRHDVVDRPGIRRVNERPIPRGGGLALVAAFVPVVIVATLLNSVLGLLPTPGSIGLPEMAGLLIGGVLAAVMGWLDDYFQLRARWQMAGQVLVALVAVVFGVTVDFVNNPVGGGLIRLNGAAAVAFTLVWIVGTINSINFIDGLDGLSSGIGVIAAITLGVISLTSVVNEPYVAILCFALAGALLGFLRWNFHPASIFVGTSGVMFVGYSLAMLSILGTAKVAVAMLVLGVPIIDTFWIIVRRLASGRSPFSADRGHLHHRLLDLGLSHVQTVLLIYGLCVGLALLAFVLSGAAQIYAFLLFVVGAGALLLLISRRAERGAGIGGAAVPVQDARPAAPIGGDGPRSPLWSPRQQAPKAVDGAPDAPRRVDG